MRTRWYAPVMNNWKGEPWSRRSSFIAAGLLVFFGVVNAGLRVTDSDAASPTTAFGLVFGLWLCALGWMYLAHAKFNATCLDEESETGA